VVDKIGSGMEFIEEDKHLTAIVADKMNGVSLDNLDATQTVDDEEEEELDGVDGGGEGEDAVVGGADSSGAKKKKKKPKKKKKSTSLVGGTKAPHSRIITGFTDYYVKYGQTEEPSKTVASLFPTGVFPEGQTMPHGLSKHPKGKSGLFASDIDGSVRLSNAEKKEAERILNEETGLYNKVRHAAEVHRQVRHYTQSFIQPGILLTDMCERIEECNRRLVKENGLQAGIGFPTGTITTDDIEFIV
jgi:methionyl aminopeptidase